MSNLETPTAATESETEDVIVSYAEAVGIAESGTLTVSVEDMEGHRSKLATLYRASIDATKRFVNANARAAAELVAIRSAIMLPNGHPDWAAKSDLYRLTVEDVTNEAFKSVPADVKRRAQGAIRQHVARGPYLGAAIASYVWRTLPGQDVDNPPAFNEAKNLADVLTTFPAETQEAAKVAIRHEYEAAELTVPEEFGGPKRGNNGGGPEDDDPQNPAATFDANIDRAAKVENIVPKYRLTGLLRLESETVAPLVDGKLGAIPDREEVLALLDRISTAAYVTAKMLRGKATAEDEAKLAASLYDPKNDR